MTILVENNVDTETKLPLTELRRLKSQAQNGERRRQLRREQKATTNKVETNSAAEDPKKTKPRKKRNFFKWLFQTDIPTNRKVAPPLSKVRVKIPIVYRNGEHKGVIVGGTRVPFSRPMQANRRSLLLHQEEINCRIPEDSDILYDFPGRLASEKYEAEQQQKMEEKRRLKEEKLARELAK